MGKPLISKNSKLQEAPLNGPFHLEGRLKADLAELVRHLWRRYPYPESHDNNLTLPSSVSLACHYS